MTDTPAPVTQGPVETPQPVVTQTLVVETAPVTPTAPVTVEAVTAPVVAETPVVTTVLGEAIDKANQPAPVTQETPVTTPEPAKVDEKAQSEEPASAPVYEPFKLPENVQLDAEGQKQFTDILADLEVKSKAEHAAVQEFGQKAVDLYISEMNRAVTDIQKYYQTAWDKQKTDWKEAFLKDPEIGGNRAQTTVDSALTFIRTHGGTPEQQQEFRNLMETSGLGNHPVMIRLLAAASKATSEGRPLQATAPVEAPRSKVATLYGKNK